MKILALHLQLEGVQVNHRIQLKTFFDCAEVHASTYVYIEL